MNKRQAKKEYQKYCMYKEYGYKSYREFRLDYRKVLQKLRKSQNKES